jgi:hypothetical protein
MITRLKDKKTPRESFELNNELKSNTKEANGSDVPETP